MKESLNIAIAGATGYVGIELIKIDLDTGKIISNNDSNTIYEAFGKSDKITPYGETLIGLEGFRSIQVDEINDDTYLVY